MESIWKQRESWWWEPVSCTDEQGVVTEPAYGALQSGDYILEADGKETPDKETLIEAISGTEGRACTFKIRREEEILETRVKTVKTEDGSIKAGIWVRMHAQGIGTRHTPTKTEQMVF